jgi:hypothetical protein
MVASTHFSVYQMGPVSRGQQGELKEGKQIDNRESLIFKGRNATDFWRTILS